MSAVYTKEVLVKGRPTPIRCVDMAGVTLKIDRGFPRIISVEDEWFAELNDPVAAMEAARDMPGVRGDVLSFWNPLPEPAPKHPYPYELEEIAVLPIQSYDDWWQHRIKSRTRNLIRKSEKQGLTVRETEFDDDFIRGMSIIFNEQPIRQGRRFWHYGKNAETIRRQFSRFVHRETMIGAYLDGEMIGFVMLGSSGRCGHLGQILSKVGERDRNPNNALMAKAIEVCVRLGHQYLVYGYWGDTSLAEFKRRCGFEPVPVPHYFVPLSAHGRLALRIGLHRGWKNLLSSAWQSRLRQCRAWYHDRNGA